jgi:hypothetical protein
MFTTQHSNEQKRLDLIEFINYCFNQNIIVHEFDKKIEPYRVELTTRVAYSTLNDPEVIRQNKLHKDALLSHLTPDNLITSYTITQKFNGALISFQVYSATANFLRG